MRLSEHQLSTDFCGAVAQLAELWSTNPLVVGSIPTCPNYLVLLNATLYYILCTVASVW